MKVYLYDPVTLEFVGEGAAHPDQMSKGDFIYPANSTPIEPMVVSDGKVAKFVDGEWIESDPTPLTIDQVQFKRAMAYADPVYGSDKYFTEAARKRASGDSEGALQAEQQGLILVAEIKNKFK